MSERRLPPHEAWDAIVNPPLDEEALDAEAKRIDALTPEELDREVAASGRDPAAERAKGAALAAKLLAERAARERHSTPAPAQPAAPERGPTPIHSARSNRIVWLVAAAAAIALVALARGPAILAWLRDAPAPSITPLHEPFFREPPPTEMAARMRDDAADACRNRDWYLCARKLDEARHLDPAGEASPATRAMRAAIYGNTHRPDAAPFDEKQ